MIGSNKKFPLPYELEEIMTVFFENIMLCLDNLYA